MTIQGETVHERNDRIRRERESETVTERADRRRRELASWQALVVDRCRGNADQLRSDLAAARTHAEACDRSARVDECDDITLDAARCLVAALEALDD